MIKKFILSMLVLAAFTFTANAQEKRIDFIQTTSVGVGVVPTAIAPYVTVQERGQGVIHQTVFTITNMPVTLIDATLQGGGNKIYTFPEGRIIAMGATGYSTVTTSTALASTLNPSVSCRWGLGTTTQANPTLATTEQDLLPVTTFTSSATINVVNTVTTSALAALAQFDGTATAKAAFFNISVPLGTDIDADSTVLVNGSITLTWVQTGDY